MSLVSQLARNHDDIRHAFQELEYLTWRTNGRRGDLPTLAKYSIFKEYVKPRRIKVVIETGTYLGDFVFALRRDFNKIYSIEISSLLYARAKLRMKNLENVELLHGDSSEILPKLLEGIRSSCGFWLDAHASGGISGSGRQETPIEQEVNFIAKHSLSKGVDHVILIDDAPKFGVSPDYPSTGDLQNILWKYDKSWKLQRLTNEILAACKVAQVPEGRKS
jgi:hypothetical protein